MRSYILCLLLISSAVNFAQSTINYKDENINSLDADGNKIGLWKVYNEPNNVLITVDYNNGGKVSYYKDKVLVAVYDKDALEIYKDSKIIKAKFFYKEDKSQTLVGEDGKELDSELIKYYAQVAESRPMFYGGTQKLYGFIGGNFKKDKKAKGKIKLKFAIDKNGYVKDISIVESTIPELNDEAIRVVKTLPRWQPGFQRNRFVNVMYTLPLNIEPN